MNHADFRFQISRLAAMAIVGMFTLSAFLGCDLANAGKATLKITTSASAASRALAAGTVISTISSYQVVFKKIEIGNSETDKYTLWEDVAGSTKDITGAVSFDGVKSVPIGTYQFVRLTIGDTLSVAGSVTDAGTVYTGTGTATLGSTVYLWGTSLLNDAGKVTLAAPLVVKDGGVMSFAFDIANTVTYGGGPANAAVLGVSKPVLTVTVQ